MSRVRPAPYVPLSLNFATGRTGTAILERFGLEGLGVWVAMLAAGGANRPQGQIVFRHEDDWDAIGLRRAMASFELVAFLRFLGQRKQTRTTRQGRVMYVQLTQWERWNNIRRREVARQQKASKRAESAPDTEADTERTDLGQVPDPEAEAEKGFKDKVKGRPLTDLGENGGLPFEKQLQISRMLGAISDADNATPAVIRSLADPLSLASLVKVRESVERHGTVGAGYVVNALKSERRETAA